MTHSITYFPDALLPIEAASLILLALVAIFAAAYGAVCRELRHKTERANTLAANGAAGWSVAAKAQMDVIRLENEAKQLRTDLEQVESNARIERGMRNYHAAQVESLRKQLVDRQRDAAGVVMN